MVVIAPLMRISIQWKKVRIALVRTSPRKSSWKPSGVSAKSWGRRQEHRRRSKVNWSTTWPIEMGRSHSFPNDSSISKICGCKKKWKRRRGTRCRICPRDVIFTSISTRRGRIGTKPWSTLVSCTSNTAGILRALPKIWTWWAQQTVKTWVRPLAPKVTRSCKWQSRSQRLTVIWTAARTWAYSWLSHQPHKGQGGPQRQNRGEPQWR